MDDLSADIAIVGSGIIGLAHAYMASKKGLKVVLFERDEFAVGASVRNFGLVWPIGQEPLVGLDYALKSREHWLEVASKAGFWINQNGSLHVARHKDEWNVLQEFAEMYKESSLQIELLNEQLTVEKSLVIKSKDLKGSLWSRTECTVNPREAIRRIPFWLKEKYGVVLRYGNLVREISLPQIKTSVETWKVEKVLICSGADFQTLYPEVFEAQKFMKCRLQMMKATINGSNNEIGPSLCGGLTLRHYASFKKCRSLVNLNERFDIENPSFKKHGIHVLIAQNSDGDIILGDSHHYDKTPDPFNEVFVDNLILKYLQSFTDINSLTFLERWQGVYAKLEHSIFLRQEVERGVTIINGFGGAGMTLSFGVAEETIDKLL